MNWKDIRLAYWPYHASCAVPGDRRRFIFYAKERKINFELANPSHKYDIVFLTYGCNLAKWMAYKKANPGTKIIFELIDSYLMEDAGLFTFFRGCIRYFAKRESKLYLNYKKALKKMLTQCDAVICSTPIQKENMKGLNNNIHVSLDYFSDDITQHKESFETNGKLKLVWEGQAYTVKNLLVINDVLEKLKDDIELHIITDSDIKFPFKIFDKKTADVLKPLKCTWHFHNWEKKNFSSIISDSDLAIIPITSSQKIMWNKPENKMLLLWEIGVPVLASATPAYKRVMDEAGLDFYCTTENEWVEKIRRYKNSTSDEKKVYVGKADAYLRSRHSKELLLEKWDRIFESVMN